MGAGTPCNETMYVCEKTKINGQDMFDLAFTKTYGDIKRPDAFYELREKKFVEDFTARHGNSFGDNYNDIARRVKEHIDQHDECREFYDVFAWHVLSDYETLADKLCEAHDVKKIVELMGKITVTQEDLDKISYMDDDIRAAIKKGEEGKEK